MVPGRQPPSGAGSEATDALQELTRENAALRERFSALGKASLRISASLDVDTVLQEIVDSARTLVGARYGVITTVNDEGALQDFVTSGLTADERHAYVRSLGLAPLPIRSRNVRSTPMRHHGRHVGDFFLGEKEGRGKFTSEDDEVLVLFAHHAATAIANARAHRAERSARADLEALVDTTPVGVVVFDGGTGRLVSFNREARRIAGALRGPGGSLEELMEVVTCHFADRDEVVVRECPIAQAWTLAETMRAEELVLSVPDGRSVRTLVNITPIRSEAGTVESVVMVMQDLAPLEALERQRTEFLELVSHELRTPLVAIKGSTATLLGGSAKLDPAEVRAFHCIIDEQVELMRELVANLLDVGRIETGTLPVSPEPSDVDVLIEQARSTFLSGGGRHALRVDMACGLPRVMADRRRIVQVLNNLLANAARHSPDGSPIRVAAQREGVYVAVSVSDEGTGVAPEHLPYLFRKYSATARDHGARGIGRGLGLAICKGLIEAHGGRIWADSAGVGQGASVSFTIPVVEARSDAGRAVAERDSPGSEARGNDVSVLVVDDDPHTLRFVRDALSDAGYAVRVTNEHRELSRIIGAERPDLVLLDLMLPGAEGIELMEDVPELVNPDLPVIFISGYGRDETIARALDRGAADYIVKPFSPTELVARVRAALRRRVEPEPFVLGDLAIHYAERRVTVAGRAVELTATEYELLRVLSENAGRVSTYDALLREVWAGRENADTEVVRAFVKSLRRKLGEDAKNPSYLFNVRGVGYRMRAR